MSNTSNARMTGISFHDVVGDDIKVTMTTHGWFSVVEIKIGKMPITLFTSDDKEAMDIISNFSKFSRQLGYEVEQEMNKASDMFTDSEYDLSLEPF